MNNYLCFRVQRNTQTGKLFVQSYKSDKAIKFEKELGKIVKEEIKKQGWILPEKDKYIIVDCVFYFPKHGMDTNNHWKVPLDVFTSSGVWVDDKRALENAQRSYIDSNDPRLEFTLRVADFIGIFDDSEHLTEFMATNCTRCKKNPAKCSIMKKALENRITGDIHLNSLTCEKLKS